MSWEKCTVAAEIVAWFEANLPAMQNGDSQPTHWVGEENYWWTYLHVHFSISNIHRYTERSWSTSALFPWDWTLRIFQTFCFFGLRCAFLLTYWIKSCRMDDFVTLSNLLHLPTHPDVARHSDGITALLSAAWGTLWCIIESPVTSQNWNLRSRQSNHVTFRWHLDLLWDIKVTFKVPWTFGHGQGTPRCRCFQGPQT